MPHCDDITSARATLAARPRGESGGAMLMVLLLMVIMGGIVVAIAIANSGAIDRARNRSDRVLARSAVDAGIESYIAALNGDYAGEHTGFYLCKDAFTELAKDIGGTVKTTAPGNLGKWDSGPYGVGSAKCSGGAKFIVEMINPDEPNIRNYWQVYSLARPTYKWGNGSKVVAYVRGWSADAAGNIVTQPRIVRAELRPGRFADYQMVADGPIYLGSGATINGPVHSNGFKDALFGMDPGSGQIYAEAGSTCTPGARFSTTKSTIGPIAVSACGAGPAQVADDTGEPVDVLRASDYVTSRIINSKNPTKCGLSNAYVQIRCYTPAQANNNGTGSFKGDDYFDVTVSGSSVNVAGAGSVSATTTCGTPGADCRGTVLVFPRNVNLSGTATGTRLTITTYSAENDTDGAWSGHSIEIRGATGTNTVPAGSDKFDVMGIMAQGDVVLDTNNTCPGTLNVALIAESGGLTIPHEWRTPSPPPGATPPMCGGISITGSLGGHFPPLMYIQYDCSSGCIGPSDTGYATREYTWDPHLYDNPPPYFPTTGPWQMMSYKDANYNCFTTGAVPQLKDPNCE